jgi:hypothetical protein
VIHFDFIWDGRVNAYVFKHEGEYFIAVNTGTVVMLGLIFSRMLADQKLFLHIGDPASESPEQPLLQRLIPDAEEMYQSGDLVVCKPKTEARLYYQNHVRAHALRFLVGHEIAHITLGHVDYLEAVYGTTIFSEVGFTDTSPKGCFERRLSKSRPTPVRFSPTSGRSKRRLNTQVASDSLGRATNRSSFLSSCSIAASQ